MAVISADHLQVDYATVINCASADTNSSSPLAVANLNIVCARICGLYRCMLPSGEARDVAFVRMFSRNDWRPRTAWKGCDVHEESRTYRFVLAQYLVRGAHMIPAFYGPTKVANERFYFNDLIDYDMFLRAGN
ncbi:hypothetical protein HWV62_7112 [Athelia sp. TMB]|nr:hypothetical protein HWV62_7112 [Athelia sp. TMB]